jgi:hypothetical protein
MTSWGGYRPIRAITRSTSETSQDKSAYLHRGQCCSSRHIFLAAACPGRDLSKGIGADHENYRRPWFARFRLADRPLRTGAAMAAILTKFGQLYT